MQCVVYESKRSVISMPQSRAPTPVENASNGVQATDHFDTSSLLNSLLCDETMQQDDRACKQWEEFDDTDWSALDAFFAAHTNAVHTVTTQDQNVGSL